MKNLWKTLFVAALFVSCSEANVDEQPVPETTQGTPIQFELVNEGGRAAFFQGEGHRVDWEGGENIAIRGWYSETLNSTTRKRGNYDVVKDSETGAISLNLTSNWTNGMVWTDDDTNHITAYYPSTNNAQANNISLTLPSAQIQVAANDHSHIDNYMIMMTPKPLDFAIGEQPEQVSLRLQSVLSIVEVTLKGDAGKKITSLELATTSGNPLAYTEGILDTTKDITAEDAACPISVTAGLSSVKLELTTPATLSAEGTKFYFVVLPGAHEKGDITIRAYMEDGSVYGMKMGAIEFKMNKVYRPSLKLGDFTELNMDAAEIEHIFANGSSSAVYGLPVSMKEGSTPILLRPHFAYTNIPDVVKNLQVATIIPSTYPTTNKIVAKTAGWVYMLVGPQTTTHLTSVRDYFKENGWQAVSVVPTKGITKTSQPKDPIMYYAYPSGENTEYAYMLVYGKEFAVDDEFDMKDYPLTNFQGIRPIAKKITNNNDDYLILPFDFSNDQQDWTIQTNFAGVLANPYTETMTYKFLNGISYALDFSYTEGTSGCSLHKEKFLLMHIRNSETGASVKLPAIEGYKLVEVKGATQGQTAGTECFICSVSAHDYAAAAEEAKAALMKSGSYTMTSGVNTSWAHTLVDPAVNTAYYLVAIDDTPKVSPHEDLRMASLVLTYQKVQ